ncbi:TetR family transcriptional regulator, partial [Pseudomonas aeruginosa]
SKHQALMSEKEKNRVLRAENDQLLAEVARLASVNQRLIFEMIQLKAVANGKVTALPLKPGPN